MIAQPPCGINSAAILSVAKLVGEAFVFKNKTVFLLGAGASWQYGYPTGEDLVKKVQATAQQVQDFCQQSRESTLLPKYVEQQVYRSKSDASRSLKAMIDAWDETAAECADLVTRLQQGNPLVIDYFLGKNRHLEE